MRGPRLFHDTPGFADLREVNVWLEQRCRELWDEVHHPEQPQRTVAEVWSDERAHLMRMPAPFDGFVEHTKRVSPTCLIALERNRYSVPASFANRPVSVRVYAARIVIVAEGQVIAEHPRVLARGRDYRLGAATDMLDALNAGARARGATTGQGEPSTTGVITWVSSNASRAR